MKVSVLMPFKNTDAFLEECLDSILVQSYKHWELLAVDDNSTDNSSAIIKEYKEKDSRIKLFVNNDDGIIPALRLAYAKSSGTFITRMDSDDVMTPGKLENLVSQLQHAGKD